MIISNRSAGLITMGLGLEAGSGNFITMQPFMLFPAIQAQIVVPASRGGTGGNYDTFKLREEEHTPIRWAVERNIGIEMEVHGKSLAKSYFVGPSVPHVGDLDNIAKRSVVFTHVIGDVQTEAIQVTVHIGELKKH